MEEINLNSHNKQEYPPMHTAEHLLNGTMVKFFGCDRSKNAHIERKKSKCDYRLENAPTEAEVAQVEALVNEQIAKQLPVTIEMMSRNEAAKLVDMSKLPDEAGEVLRIVRIGDYDACACIGAHVENTSEIGGIKITTHSFENGVWRVRFKLINS